jgi:predicted dehydrogenase
VTALAAVRQLADSPRIDMDRRGFLALPLAAGAVAQALGHPQAVATAEAARLRVGLIGHTGQGHYGHDLDVAWKAIADAPRSGIELVAVADADAQGLAMARARLGGLSGFRDYHAMLATARPDIVVVCPRYAHEHHDMAIAAIEAGARGLYVEKPFARTLAEADQIVARAQARHVAVVVAHRNRHHPALPVIAAAVRAGAFGPVLELRARGKEDQRGGGQDLCVLGGHLFNAATLFTGAPQACTAGIAVQGRPAAMADVREGDEGVGRIAGDEIHARFETASGMPLFYDSRRGAGTTAAGFGIQIFCRDALVDLRMDVVPLVHVRRGHPFVPSSDAYAWQPFSSAGLGNAEPVADIRGLVLGHRGGIVDLIACVREQREPLCGATAARETIEMIQAVFASCAAGGRVTIPLQDREWPLR